MIRLLIADVDGTLVTRDKILIGRARGCRSDARRADRIRHHRWSAATGNADVDPAVGAHHPDGVHKL